MVPTPCHNVTATDQCDVINRNAPDLNLNASDAHKTSFDSTFAVKNITPRPINRAISTKHAAAHQRVEMAPKNLRRNAQSSWPWPNTKPSIFYCNVLDVGLIRYA